LTSKEKLINFTCKFNTKVKLVRLNVEIIMTQVTEELILKAAHKIFTQKGYAATRMEDIAEEAGINRALLHYYFRSKEKMFGLVFEDVFRGMFSGIQEILSSKLALNEKIAGIVSHEIDTMAKNPDLPLFVIAELTRDPNKLADILQVDLQRRKLMVENLDNQLKEEIQKGNIKEISAFSLLLSIMGLCVWPFAARGLIQSILGFDKSSFVGIAAARKEELIRFIIDGLRP